MRRRRGREEEEECHLIYILCMKWKERMNQGAG